MKTLLFGNGAVSLDDVYPYQNINLAPEADFDDLTRLAACVCQTPIALLCLMDARRLCLKSQVGLEQGTTDSYLALCTETLRQVERWDSRVLMVQDASADRWLASCEVVKSSQQVRFYAGTPIITPEGVILGILSVIDHVPRSLTLQQQEALSALSRQAIAQLQLRKHSTTWQGVMSKHQQVEETRQASQKELANIKLGLAQSPIRVSKEVSSELGESSPAEGDRSKVCIEASRFFALSPELLCVVGLDGYFKRVNPAFEKTLSYTTEELLSRRFLDFVHPEDKAATQAEFEKLSTKAGEINFENRYRCQDGSYKRLAWKSVSFVEEGLVYAIARDITKSKRTKATLRERSHVSTLEADVGTALGQSGTMQSNLKRCTEAMVQHLDASGVGIWTVEPSAVGTSDLLPMDLQASAGQLIPADTFPNHIPANHELISIVAQTRQPLNTQLSTQGGNGATASTKLKTFFTGYPLIIESRLVGVMALLSRQPFSEVVDGVLGWVANAIAMAIDRSWAREELLSRREALLFRLASQIRNSLDLDTILGTAVTEIRSLLDVDCCHFLWCWSEPNQPSLSVTHEACNPRLPSLLEECPPTHLESLDTTIRNLQTLRIDSVAEVEGLAPETRSLLTAWGITSALLLPLKTKTGQLGAIVCSHYDEPRLWSDHEVELLQAVVDQLAIAIEQAELFAKTRAAALAAQTQARQLELALEDLQQTETWLIQTEKMSGLGQMVAGVAHEINNPVNFITGNLSHATNYIQDLLELIEQYQQYYPNPVPEIQEHIEEIDLEFLIDDLPKILSSMKIGAERIHEIVLSLRNFSRLDEVEMKPVNIHEGIDSTLLILHNRLKPKGHNPGIKIIKEYGSLPLVECYAGQINQVFMNIISNAIDALESGGVREEESHSEGELAPSAAHLITPSPIIWIHTEVLGGEQVLIRIRDNGPGMTQSVVRRLFDPFFTTKPVGKGTGLGLSISHQIVVEKHGGILKCLSELGQGTEFWIQIPITQPKEGD
jgi:PAS domain S-box-containing protein